VLSIAASALMLGSTTAAATETSTGDTTVTTDGVGDDAIITADWGDVTARQEDKSLDASGVWTPEKDAGSLFSLTQQMGIQQAWAADVTGHDITVAVIDTGVAPVPGLTASSNKVMNGPDLSFDGQTPATRFIDGFGHGTHMAGIIAGQDATWDKRVPDPGVFAGVAPEAQILNMKVGSADGGVDVSQVIAALNWIVQHKGDGGMHVRVVSLAYGTMSVQPWQVDPLARAVEDAWKAGIVVVAAAGNDGLATSSLLMPALDPHVIAVGASDPMSTVDPADDVVADFTNGGSDVRRPDVLAPGRSIVSLRVAGSYADEMSPEGRVTGDSSGRFFRGSGTSQATAFTAGVVALLLDREGSLTPDQVKALLMDTARPVAQPQAAAGAGIVDVPAALALAKDLKTESYGIIDERTKRVLAPLNSSPWSSGAGSLDASRGGGYVVDPATGTPLVGEIDALGAPWNGAAWAALSGSRKAWNKGVWNGRSWTGDGFDKQTWKFAAWGGSTWAGVPWASHTNTATWEARTWRGQNWEARTWREESWSARTWRALF
jgi:serine protease AprX